MPKITFSDENRSKSSYDFNKLTLEQNERGRITAIEGTPEFEYVHTLRAPQLVNGRPVMETVTYKEKSGAETQKEVMKTDFIGQHICIGDINVLAEKQADVNGCPVCKASKDSDAVEPAKRRFAMHVIRYKCSPGTFNVQDPFNVDLVVWAFADKVFNRLIELSSEWGNLQERDLNLGPCINKMYQNYDIAIASKCEWRDSDHRMQQVAAIYQSQKIEDLSVALGRRATRDQIEEDLGRVLTRYEIAMGRRGEASVTPTEVTSQVNVGDILGGMGSTPTAATTPTQASAPMSFEAPKEEAPLADRVEAKPEDKGKLNLDAILGL